MKQAVFLMIVNEVSADFRVPLSKGKVSISASTTLEKINHRRVALSKDTSHIRDSTSFITGMTHTINYSSGVKNKRLYDKPLLEKVINSLGFGETPKSKRVGKMSMGS